MRHIALCHNHYMNWYYFVKINKKSITWQEQKYANQRAPSDRFDQRNNTTLEKSLDKYKDDNVLLMRFYE